MPLEKSEAVILKIFNWSESSRTVVFFTEKFGKLPLVDKAGRRLTSKRGRLLTYSRLELTFYHSKKESSGYISDCELLEMFPIDNEGSLGRLSYAAAVCELLYYLLPDEEEQKDIYEYLLNYLNKISNSDKQSLPALFVSFLLRLMSQLGYRPSLAYCSVCSKDLEKYFESNSKLSFSSKLGGIVCNSCQKAGEYYIHLSAQSARLLSMLQKTSLTEAAKLPIGFSEANRLIELLTDFLQFHAGLSSKLKSLSFLDKLKNSQLDK